MSYTEHTWVDGETITAAKMNNIEEGISEAAQSGGGGTANVFIDSYGNGSMSCLVVIYQDREGSPNKSIESVEDMYSEYGILLSGYQKKFVKTIPVNLPEGFHIGIAFDEYMDLNFDITTTGQIAQEPVSGSGRSGASSWTSAFYDIYEVLGDGTVTITPK